MLYRSARPSLLPEHYASQTGAAVASQHELFVMKRTDPRAFDSLRPFETPGAMQMTEQAELTRPETRGTIQTINPATGEPGKSYDEASLADAQGIASAAHSAFLEWRRTTFAARSAGMP
jgi:hypothetical protein